jgi:hypothetical protein
MRSFLLVSCVLLLFNPGCNLPPLPRGPAAAAESPPTASPSLPQRVEQRAAAVGAALGAGYGRIAAGAEEVIDSEAMRTALRPFIYAPLPIGYCAARVSS